MIRIEELCNWGGAGLIENGRLMDETWGCSERERERFVYV